MTDPFGAIHNQNIGDIGVFIGSGSWAASGQMPTQVPVRIVGPQSTLATVGSYGWQSREGRRMFIADGSSANPVTSGDATVFITRESKVTSSPDWGALNVTLIADSGTTVQPEGISISVQQNGNVDAVGFAANVVTLGNAGVAFGGYLQVEAKTSGGGADGLNIVVANSTGANHTYSSTPTSNTMNGIAIQTIVDAAHTSGTAIITLNNGVQWDVGIAFQDGTVKTATFFDESASVASFQVKGSHTYAVDVSGATLSGFAWHGALSADDQISSQRATGNNMFVLAGTGTGATTYGMTVTTGGAFDINEVGVAFKFEIAKGTPGAGNTCMWVQQGAGPTLSQIKYKSGTALVAGDNVLYF